MVAPPDPVAGPARRPAGPARRRFRLRWRLPRSQGLERAFVERLQIADRAALRVSSHPPKKTPAVDPAWRRQDYSDPDAVASGFRSILGLKHGKQRWHCRVKCSVSLALLQLRHRVPRAGVLCLELDLVADLHLLKHRGVLDAEGHGHSLVHAEILDRPMLEGDLAG